MGKVRYDLNGSEPVEANVSGVRLIMVLNWYSANSTKDDRAAWALAYAKKHLHLSDACTKALADAAGDIVPTIPHLARAIDHGTTFAEVERVTAMVETGLLRAATVKPKVVRRKEPLDRATIDSYWSIFDRIEDAERTGRYVVPSNDDVPAMPLRARTLITERINAKLAELAQGIADKENAYGNYHLKAGIRAARSLLSVVNGAPVPTAHRTYRRRKVNKPASKIVAKVQCLPEWHGLRSIDPAAIIGSKLLVTFDTKTRKLTLFKSESGLSVTGKHVVCDTAVGKKVRKPDVVVPKAKRGAPTFAQRVFDAIRTKPSDARTIINKNTLLLRVA